LLLPRRLRPLPRLGPLIPGVVDDVVVLETVVLVQVEGGVLDLVDLLEVGRAKSLLILQSEKSRWYVGEEARRCVEAQLAEDVAGLGQGEDEALFGAGEAHVAEAALLLERFGRAEEAQGTHGGKDAFLHAGEDRKSVV